MTQNNYRDVSTPLTQHDTSLYWKVIRRRLVLDTPHLIVEQDKVQLPSGDIIDDFYTVRGSQLVSTLAFDSSGRVLAVRQYRHAVGKVTIDLPGGAVDPHELPEVAALRELQEETGYTGTGVTKLLTYFPDSGRKGDIKHLFRVRSVEEVVSSRPTFEHECIQPLWIHPEAILSSNDNCEPTILLALLYSQFLQPPIETAKKL